MPQHADGAWHRHVFDRTSGEGTRFYSFQTVVKHHYSQALAPVERLPTDLPQQRGSDELLQTAPTEALFCGALQLALWGEDHTPQTPTVMECFAAQFPDARRNLYALDASAAKPVFSDCSDAVWKHDVAHVPELREKLPPDPGLAARTKKYFRCKSCTRHVYRAPTRSQHRWELSGAKRVSSYFLYGGRKRDDF